MIYLDWKDLFYLIYAPSFILLYFLFVHKEEIYYSISYLCIRNILLYFLSVHKEINIWDQFSHLIVRVSVLHVAGTLGM